MTNQIEHLHVACYRWGTRYGVEYVNKLFSMVGRHLSGPFTFHCVTDDPSGLSPGIVPHALPANHFGGNWNKLMNFQADFLGLRGARLLALDIDIVIVDSIDFVRERPELDFIIAKNWAKDGRGNSSFYRLKVGSHARVWEDFARAPEAAIEQWHGVNRRFGDQRWMSHAIADYAFFPEGRIVSFKEHCAARSREWKLPFGFRLTHGTHRKARPPKGASVVLFHGVPLPPDVMDFACGRWRHAPFVAEHWR
jgi:hypothetical protein